jgi:selenocysteine-specific elongation factor
MGASVDDVETILGEVVPAAGAVSREQVLVRSRWSKEAIAAAIDKVQAGGYVVDLGDFVCHRTWFEEICRRSEKMVAKWHEQRPMEAGMPMTEWKWAMVQLGAATILSRVLEQKRDLFEVRDHRIRLRSHRPQLPAYLVAAERRLREELERHPFNAPSRPQLAPDLRNQQALDYLLAIGEVVSISPTVLISRAAFQEAVVRVRQFLRGHRGATVADLKQMLGSNRRVMVPLLEALDARGITKRMGDLRVLCEASAERQVGV